MPVIIGLAEVENRFVLKDLLSKTDLSSYNYAIIHEESPDYRGIDVALIYDADYFQYILHDTIRINFPFKPGYKTRDILYVLGILNKTDTLHLFVNHWPSRKGKKKTTHKRIEAAKVLRHFINSLSLVYHQPKIIVMGDFNDEPWDKSITELTNGKLYNPFNSPPQSPSLSDNLVFFDREGKVAIINFHSSINKGTYYYKGRWYMLDHLMLSHSLLDSTATIYFKPGNAKIFKPGWLLYQSIPFPTYQWPKYKRGYSSPWQMEMLNTYKGPYKGGYSDHLPVYIDLIN